MGRRAKPIDLHLLEGNKNRKTKKEIEARKKVEEAITPGADKVNPPKWLSKEAKEEFKRISGELMPLKLITNADINAIARYCDAYIDYKLCTKIIEEEGLMVEYTNKSGGTNRVPHPLLAKKKQLHDQMLKLEGEFGLTAAARAKIAIPRKEEKEPTDFEKMFGDI